METSEILNPFGFGNVTKLLDENRKPAEYWLEYISTNEVFTENEFYVLFTDGMLVKKGRSKFRTSQYIKGEKFTSFKKVYARVQRKSNRRFGRNQRLVNCQKRKVW